MLLPVAIAAALTLSAAPGADAAWALQPGFERLFQAVMPVRQGELREGWGLTGLTVPRDRVVATYGPAGERHAGCGDAPLCLELLHPSVAGEAGTRASWFTVVARTGARADEVDASALVAGVAARLEQVGGADPWKAVEPRVELTPPAEDAERVDGAAGGSFEARFRAFLAGDADLLARLSRVEVEDAVVRYHLRTDSGAALVVELTDRSARTNDPAEVTRSFVVVPVGGVPDPPDLAARVHAAVRAADDGTLRLQAPHVLSRGELPPLHLALVVLSGLLLLSLLLVAPVVTRWAAQTLRGERLALALLAAGVALRLLLPHRMVEMGIGYQLARFADELILPRYGAGTTTLHHAVFAIFGADHLTMVWTHRVLGALTLPVACAVGVRLLDSGSAGHRARPAGLAALWAGALALTPMLLRSDLTESNLVPVLLAIWLALACWIGTRGVLRVAGTSAGLAFAALSRPEMLVVAPGLWLLLCRPWRERLDAGAVALLLITPLALQGAFVREVVAWETAEASLHLRSSGLWDKLPQVLANNGLLDPRISPALVPLLGWVGLLAAHSAALWTRWALALGGLAWLYVYAVDLSLASIPRLHVVGLLAWSLLAAAGAARLLAWRRPAGLAAITLWGLSALATVPALWAPTNEDTQDALYDELDATLPRDGPWVLALLGSADAPDQPGHYTHRHAPVYRFRGGRLSDLGRIPGHLDGDAEVFYFQGVGCYARLNRALAGESGLLPACAAVHQRFELEPLWRREVPNHGNPVHQNLLYYGDDPAFEVGLWRVRGLRGEELR